ncbi:MAG TPA: hypothetical protein DCR44_02135 [Acholeplasmatales bacterium]|nr:MAG: hypothetical protein A2Y16_03630 [Tenericutes bacterium GWF2_57_13]HAQ56191.1 hypothetical protein [Acholeplasmatales bacterium]
MKRFFANLILLLSVILTGVVLIPFNNLVQWGLNFPIVTTYEIYIKGGVAGLMFLFAVIYLIVSLHDEKNYGEVKPSVAQAGILPLWLFGVAILGYATLMQYMYWAWFDHTTTNMIILGGAALGLVNAIALGHLVIGNFRKGGMVKKIMLFLFALELAGVGGYSAYLVYQKFDPAAYQALNTLYYAAAPVLFLVFYIVHLIIQAAGRRRELAEEVETSEPAPRPERQPEKNAPVAPAPAPAPKHGKKDLRKAELQPVQNKTIIVDKNQSITTTEQNVDPTTLLFDDVEVDPEFNKTANLDRQVSSIEYYIEKPKMFKPLDPTFDSLVQYVRELPNVVTKLADDRITFYLDRKPFLVLMNFGNYYRMAFRSELERGIRMIIKYPTISKNKGTKDNLWFKANNYGDLPKEVVYDIVKSAFDIVHA